MIIKFENFLTEKLGINDDVIFLVNFILNEINDKDKETLIINKIPNKTSFKINKIKINFINNNDVKGGFNSSRSKYTKDGYDLFLYLNINTDIKSTLYHELTHIIKYQNLTKKNIKMLSNNNLYPDYRFDKLLYLLYYSDDSEINAKVSEIYSKIEDLMKDNLINNKEIFKTYIDNLIFMENDNPQMLINYDIFKDLKDISDKDKIKFFNYITTLKNIKKTTNNKFFIFFKMINHILFNKKDLNLEKILTRTQNHINSQGEKLLKKLSKLYDLF